MIGVTINKHMDGSNGPYDYAMEMTVLKDIPFENI